jgi:hypothetical protein
MDEYLEATKQYYRNDLPHTVRKSRSKARIGAVDIVPDRTITLA